MITLDWKERLIQDCHDFFERKIPQDDYDFDIIYNAYPQRKDNKIPIDVITLVATTLASKMIKRHRDFVPFCDYIWKNKGLNGKIVFVCIINKFLKKDFSFYFEYVQKYLFQLSDPNEINLLLDKIFLPIFKKQPLENIDTMVFWLQKNNEKINPSVSKIIIRIGKTDKNFFVKFTEKLEKKWSEANPDFAKICGYFLKQLSKVDYNRYLDFYKNYQSSRDPIIVEILTLALVQYDDFIYQAYENWGKSGNARLKKTAIAGLKFLKKRKP